MLDKTFFEDFFVAKPEIGDVGGAEAKNVFERAADLTKVEINADALEQFDQRVGALRQNRLGRRDRRTQRHFQAVKSDDVNGLGPAPMTDDAKEATGFGLGRGGPGCET